MAHCSRLSWFQIFSNCRLLLPPSPSTKGGRGFRRRCVDRCLSRTNRSTSNCRRKCRFSDEDILDLFDYTGGFSDVPKDQDFEDLLADMDEDSSFDEDYDSFDGDYDSFDEDYDEAEY